MCQDLEHGGRRCPNDTSDIRRVRRKASVILSRRKEKPIRNFGEHITTTGNLRLEEFKKYADLLRKEVYNAPKDPKAQSDYDMKMEEKITAFGLEIASEADKMAGYNPILMQEKIDTLKTEIFDDTHNELDILGEKYSSLRKQWRTLALKKHIHPDTSPNSLTNEQIKLLSETEQQLIQDYLDNKEKSSILRNSFTELDIKFQEEKVLLNKEMNEKLTKAYQTIIASIRPVGHETHFNTKNAGEAIQVMKDTVATHYPSAWLEKHNMQNGSEVILGTTTERAAYNAAIVSDTEDDGIKKPMTAKYLLFSQSDTIDQIHKAFPHMNGVLISSSTYNTFTQEFIKGINYDYDEEEIYDRKKHGFKKPSEKDGWEFRATIASTDLPELQKTQTIQRAMKILTKKRWVRKNLTTKKIAPRLQIFDKETAKNLNHEDKHDYQKAVAYHEFGHRIEAVLSDKILTRQEKAFLKRRAGKTDENFYENMINVGTKDEYAHEGKFISKYVGRDYYNENNYEVFTTGIEALYGGSYGGLVGNSITFREQDLDHRGFVLGTLATL